MDQEPATPTPEPADGKPKFWSGINGVIAGLTGLVVAVGGLVTAYSAIRGDKPAEQRQADTADTDAAKMPLAQPEVASAAEIGAPTSMRERQIYTGDLFDDGKFEGGAMSLKHNGESWVLTADQAYEYEQMASPDPDRILAYNADYGSYLRWPVKGGEVEESLDKKKSWSRYAKVTASEPTAD